MVGVSKILKRYQKYRLAGMSHEMAEKKAFGWTDKKKNYKKTKRKHHKKANNYFGLWRL